MPSLLQNALLKNKPKLKRFKFKETSWVFSQRYRFLEWSFADNEPVYVLGYAGSGIKAPKKWKLKMKMFLQAKKSIEQDSALSDHFDTNKDGFLDENEMERGAKLVGMKMQMAEEKKELPEEPPKQNIKLVFLHKKPHLFIISNMKESELVKKLTWTSTLKVLGGPVMFIVSAYFLSQGHWVELWNSFQF